MVVSHIMGQIGVHWVPPLEGWVKVNTDGAVKYDSNVLGCGGLTRDNDERWIHGYARPLGFGSTFSVECWDVTWELGYRKVQLEIDSSTLFQC